jgi:hypothetical protein
MNERIKDLALQAKIEFTYDPTEKPIRAFAECWEDELEKFAELIVQECARIARATPCPYEEDEVRQRLGHTWDMAASEAGREIVNHFGVK